MAFIGESRKSSEHPWGVYLCLDREECEMLLKAVGKVEGQMLKTLTYYKDKLESGDASEKDTDKLTNAEEKFETILSIRESMLLMIKSK